ncbi:hypothetical protein ACHRV1_04785 [Flavobacterium aquidurense]|uniref:hypothetical protein n=1 Tax=Flavobacterium aquidurense TaxID=362413 RepID=UPI0037579ED4
MKQEVNVEVVVIPCNKEGCEGKEVLSQNELERCGEIVCQACGKSRFLVRN